MVVCRWWQPQRAERRSADSDPERAENALTKQYQALFNLEGVDLEFRDEALTAIAKKAMVRKTGARGLRSIVEAALLDTMYDLPSLEEVDKVVIDESVIAGQSKPLLIYGKHEAQQASGE